MGILAYLIIKTPLFLIFISIGLIKVILNIWYYKAFGNILLKREKRSFLVLSIIDILIYIQLILANVISIPYSVTIISLVFYYFIQIYSNCQCQNEEEIDVIFNFFGSIYLTLMIIQNSLILLKLDKFIDWYWRQVFCSYWISLSILAGSVLIMTLFSLATFEGVCNRRNWKKPLTIDCKKIIITWLGWSSALTLLIILIKVLLCVYNFLEDDKKNKDDIIVSFFMLFIWNLFIILIILIIKRTIYDIFEELFDQMEYSNESESNVEEESVDIKPKKNKKKVNLNEIPGFIQKFTATYFKFKNSSLKSKRDKKKIKKKNGSEEKNEYLFLYGSS